MRPDVVGGQVPLPRTVKLPVLRRLLVKLPR